MPDMPEEQKGRWAGRNAGKDAVRNRIWAALEENGVSVGPAWSVIPNFVGADTAAWRLAQTQAWKRARTIKTNPDAPQIPIRLRALYEGKTVYAPVPYLTRDFPYLRLDPKRLTEKGISFELAAVSEGFVEHGERIGFEDVEPLDFCVVGSVAVSRAGGRTGKGAGFADLETAIFRELGTITDETPLVTTVHSLQLVTDDEVVIEPHDSPLDMVATDAELIVTGNRQPRPAGVDWDHVQPDQFETIPFLTELKTRMLNRRKTG
ncbi:5-formyltetrahydrofolate cyclo-ligase [Rhizobium sp. RU35A]|uniref:5-formyltetrahydrofolate cyclo-ligase n=1 Tax=Rhizobium straminoryzae TaxID=1387186 RepID=A0A549TBG5_9HYPH|nr:MULTISPECIES: 5-formyltetrahydrofolate cyclo-ligase [Rhizobium]TRL39226.1 5-formyltetrahydrofolate cyclo-ligase [Rhizobium straminoryzae]SIQ37569.1 5-formyltetrahydrofolate cyclo-ligase [Rhizobium sp. RU35A]